MGAAGVGHEPGALQWFLSAGLLWSLLREPSEGRRIARFFLGCVVLAGVFGDVTAKPSIAVVQTLPGLVAFALFLLERELPSADLDGDAKLAALEIRRQRRDTEARAITDRLRQWAEQQKALPRSALAEAIGYLLGNWKGLTTFLDDPLIPLDSNRTERALRGMVLGRKNHYGSRSVPARRSPPSPTP